MLAKIDVTICIHELSDTVAGSVYKVTFKYYAVHHQESTLTVRLVIEELTLIYATINHAHLSLVAFIILPLTLEITSFYPANDSKAFTSACVPVAFISCLFVLGSVWAWQTVVVLHSSKSTRPTILKITPVFISILKVNDTKAKMSYN